MLTGNIDIAGHATPFVTQVRGRSAPQGTPQLAFYDRPDSLIERGLLSRGARGFVVLLPDGPPSAGERCEVWPVTAHGPANGWDEIGQATRWSCDFAVDSRPEVEGVQA